MYVNYLLVLWFVIYISWLYKGTGRIAGQIFDEGGSCL